MFRAVFLPIIGSVKPYNGFGTILSSLVTDCCQEQQSVTELHEIVCTKAVVRLITLLMMGRKTAPETCRVIVPLIKIGNLQCICWSHS